MMIISIVSCLVLDHTVVLLDGIVDIPALVPSARVSKAAVERIKDVRMM